MDTFPWMRGYIRMPSKVEPAFCIHPRGQSHSAISDLPRHSRNRRRISMGERSRYAVYQPIRTRNARPCMHRSRRAGPLANRAARDTTPLPQQHPSNLQHRPRTRSVIRGNVLARPLQHSRCPGWRHERVLAVEMLIARRELTACPVLHVACRRSSHCAGVATAYRSSAKTIRTLISLRRGLR